MVDAAILSLRSSQENSLKIRKGWIAYIHHVGDLEDTIDSVSHHFKGRLAAMAFFIWPLFFVHILMLKFESTDCAKKFDSPRSGKFGESPNTI